MSEELEKELSTRQWPPVANRLDRWLASREPHVAQGRFFNRELRLYMNVSQPLPPGESAISALACGGNGQIYGVTRGARSHLFYYSTEPLGDAVVEMAFGPHLEGVRACGNSLVATENGLYGAVSEYDPGRGDLDGGFIFVHSTRHDTTRAYHSGAGPTHKLIVPAPGEGVATIALAGQSSAGRRPSRAASGRRRTKTAGAGKLTLIGLTTETGRLFALDLGQIEGALTGGPGPWRHAAQLPPPSAEELRFLELPAGLARPGPHLASGLDGAVYGVGCGGELFRISPEADRIERLPLRLPQGDGVTCAAVDPARGIIYFGAAPQGSLVAFDPAGMTIRDFGSAPPVPPIRTMTVAPDGSVYGLAGPRDSIALLFRAAPLKGKKVGQARIEQLGAVVATSERYWHGYEFDAACTGPRGELYFGESDRISHLFLYYPSYAGR